MLTGGYYIPANAKGACIVFSPIVFKIHRSNESLFCLDAADWALLRAGDSTRLGRCLVGCTGRIEAGTQRKTSRHPSRRVKFVRLTK